MPKPSIDKVDIERSISGLPASERLRVRQEQSAPLLADLKAWLREERSRLSRSASVVKPIDYLLKRWNRFACFLDDGRICLSNNAAERALRGFALGRKSSLFAGSERMMTLIMTCLCRTRHKQVYAARGTMPNKLIFPRIRSNRHTIGSA